MKKKIKIICLVGARPNFIKIAPLLQEIKKHQRIKPILVHTGQHYDFEMSKVFFQDLKIPKPNYNLNIGSGLHGEQTGKIMIEFEKVCLKEKPDLVIVVGDVNSTLAGALVAAKLHIPVAHIEAGLRSFDRQMPEEINRVMADHISDYLFCPIKTAVNNLKKEGITKNVFLIKDPMQEILEYCIKIAKKKSKILENLNLQPKKYLLATIHRAENTDNKKKLTNIINAFIQSQEKIVLPLHPRTGKYLVKHKLLKRIKKSNIKLIKPVGYLDMVWLEKNAKKILTDSGGVQKEAFWLKTPCITLRNETEWVETIKEGGNIIVGCDIEKIIKAIRNFDIKKKDRKYFNRKGIGKFFEKII